MKLILFLGGGVWVPSGLPTVGDLTKRLFEGRSEEDITAARLREFLGVIPDYDTADIAKVDMSPQWNYRSSERFIAAAKPPMKIYSSCASKSRFGISVYPTILSQPRS